MIGHTVRITHILRCAVVAAALADGFLAVPVRELHKVQHPDRHTHLNVALPDVAPQIVDARAGRAACDIRFRLCTGLALVVVGVAVIAANVHNVPLSLAVPSVGVGGGDVKALCFLIRDLEFQAVSALCPLVPKLRDSHQLTGHRIRHAHHPAPRVQVVKWASVTGCPRSVRGRVHEAGGLVCAAPHRCAGAVPHHAVDVPVGQLHISRLSVRRDGCGILRRLSVLGGGDGVGAAFRYGEVHCPRCRRRLALRLAPLGAGDGGAAVNAHMDGGGEIGERRRVLLHHRDRHRIRGSLPVLGGLDGVCSVVLHIKRPFSAALRCGVYLGSQRGRHRGAGGRGHNDLRRHAHLRQTVRAELAVCPQRRDAVRHVDGELIGVHLPVRAETCHAARRIDRELAGANLAVRSDARNAARRIDGELAGANLAVLSQSGHSARCVDRELADRHLSVCPQPRFFGKSRRHRTAGQQLVAVLRRHRVERLRRNAALAVAFQDTAGGDLVLLVRNGLTDTLVRVFILVVCLDGSRHAFCRHQRRSVDGHLQRPAAARKLQQPVECVHIVRHVRLAGDFHARVRIRLK